MSRLITLDVVRRKVVQFLKKWLSMVCDLKSLVVFLQNADAFREGLAKIDKESEIKRLFRPRSGGERVMMPWREI